MTADGVVAAEVVLPCDALAPTLAFFTERLGFRLDAIIPADAPSVAELSGHGLRLRLDARAGGAPAVLRLRCRDPDALAGGERALTAPNGTRVVLVEARPPLVLPPLEPAFVVSRAGDPGAWGTGRAGMRYRDILPGRFGGRFVASQIAIPRGGPVPDQVHFHHVRFQLIVCLAGWVRLVYEDQGPPFVLVEGDAVLQPPGIRHRVLEASAGLEVLELGSPAVHETRLDHELVLPTGRHDPARVFSGQRFHRHVAAHTPWTPAAEAGFEQRDLGLDAPSGGVGRARVLRAVGGRSLPDQVHHDELRLWYLLAGAATVGCADEPPARLGPGDGCALPAGRAHHLRVESTDLAWLEVTVAPPTGTDP